MLGVECVKKPKGDKRVPHRCRNALSYGDDLFVWVLVFYDISDGPRPSCSLKLDPNASSEIKLCAFVLQCLCQ